MSQKEEIYYYINLIIKDRDNDIKTNDALWGR